MSGLRIAVCEDEQVQAQIIKLYIDQMIEKRTVAAVRYYSSGERLMKDISSGLEYDVYLLDIELPGVSGVELAAVIRKKYPKAAIVFLTSHSEYITQAFRLNSTQYLLKPITMKALKRVILQIAREKKNSLFVEPVDERTVASIPFDEIVFVEFYHNTLSVHTIKTKYVFVRNVDQFKQMFMDRGFIQTHQGYFANPLHISYIQGFEVYCKNQMVVPISARKKKSVLNQFSEYIRDVRETELVE